MTREHGMTRHEGTRVVSSELRRNVTQAGRLWWHYNDLPLTTVLGFLNFCPNAQGAQQSQGSPLLRRQ